MGIISFAYLDNFFIYGVLVGIIVIAFWLWSIIDCAKRNFKKDWEKVVWILIIVVFSWIGALAYFILIPIFNPKGFLGK